MKDYLLKSEQLISGHTRAGLDFIESTASHKGVGPCEFFFIHKGVFTCPVLGRSWESIHKCCGFVSTAVMSRKWSHHISSHLLNLTLPYLLSVTFPSSGGGIVNVVIRTKHSVAMYVYHLHHLWVFEFIVNQHKRKLLWWDLRATLHYGYKQIFRNGFKIYLFHKSQCLVSPSIAPY